MRDLDQLDDELRLISVVRRAIRSDGGNPSSAVADRLLDERIELGRTDGQPNIPSVLGRGSTA